MLIWPIQSRLSYADPMWFHYCPFLNNVSAPIRYFLFWAYYFPSNPHSIFFQALSDFSSVGQAGFVFSYFLFDSFHFKIFSVPFVSQNSLHLGYLTFPPSHLILRKENRNVFDLFKVYVRTITATSFCNLREFSLVTY